MRLKQLVLFGCCQLVFATSLPQASHSAFHAEDDKQERLLMNQLASLNNEEDTFIRVRVIDHKALVLGHVSNPASLEEAEAILQAYQTVDDWQLAVYTGRTDRQTDLHELRLQNQLIHSLRLANLMPRHLILEISDNQVYLMGRLSLAEEDAIYEHISEQDDQLNITTIRTKP